MDSNELLDEVRLIVATHSHDGSCPPPLVDDLVALATRHGVEESSRIYAIVAGMLRSSRVETILDDEGHGGSSSVAVFSRVIDRLIAPERENIERAWTLVENLCRSAVRDVISESIYGFSESIEGDMLTKRRGLDRKVKGYKITELLRHLAREVRLGVEEPTYRTPEGEPKITR